MKSILFLLLLVSIVLAKPREPYSLTLDKDKIQTIPVHTEIETLLVFPSEVSSILGNGLTPNTETQGSVIYQQGKVNPKTIVLRHLDGRSKVMMTVMMGDDAFVFKLEPDAAPASVIYLRKSGNVELGKVVTEEEALLQARPVSGERVEELFRLAGEAKLLKPRIPQEYEGYSDKFVSFPNIRDGLRTSVARMVRFDRDRALLFFGSIRNLSNQPVHIDDRIGMLKVGGKRLYRPTFLRASKAVIVPNEIISFQGVLIGNAESNPLSLDNEFRLHLTKNK